MFISIPRAFMIYALRLIRNWLCFLPRCIRRQSQIYHIMLFSKNLSNITYFEIGFVFSKRSICREFSTSVENPLCTKCLVVVGTTTDDPRYNLGLNIGCIFYVLTCFPPSLLRYLLFFTRLELAEGFDILAMNFT